MSTTGLLPALLAVQQEARTLPKDAINPHFRSRYTPLDTIVEHIGPILSKHGLVWSALPCRDEHGEPALKYRLAHAESGQVLEDTMPLLLTKADPQGMGSAITYARRYSLCAVLNLVADEDDDGNAGSQASDSRPKTTAGRAGAASKKQLDYLTSLCKQHGMSDDDKRALLREVGWDGGTLTGVIASAAIERLKEGGWPIREGGSDVPSDADGFQHETVTPEEIAETFDATEDAA